MKRQIFSAPGRVEIGGNHTDHQCGSVFAAAIDLETKCTASANGTNKVRIQDERFGAEIIDLQDLEANEKEYGSSASLVRGVAAWFKWHGHPIGGFDANVTSDIPVGSGLSSSAAYEVLIGTVFNGLFNAEVSPVDMARAGQFAENIYFGKPCGLMDQIASSLGGLVQIDFQDRQPEVTPIHADFSGYTMCVVSTGGSHEDLTHEYAAITLEMKSVAAFFDKEFLSEVPAGLFYSELKQLRRLGDRAVLRAAHFFEETKRVKNQADALKKGNMREFLDLVIESGRSSLAYLQNVYSAASPEHQGLTLALMLSEKILSGKGAWRVHGGGFAGTILAFIPDDMREEYRRQMCDMFSEGCCFFLNVNEKGGREIFSDGV
jgi:galactokinase